MERPSRRSWLARSAAEVLGDGLMRRTRSETWMLSTGVVPVLVRCARRLLHRGSPWPRRLRSAHIGDCLWYRRRARRGDRMNFRRLQYFVKIVDVGSLTQAADILHVAQPALSQQLATLEAEVRQQLLVRTKRGVTPTAAGTALYRHAQLILRQVEQARADMKAGGTGAVGRGVGRPRAGDGGGGPGRAAAAHRARAAIPGIVLYLNETYGTTLSELIMTGRMDMAVLYGGTTAVHGLVVPAAAARAALPRRRRRGMPARPRPWRSGTSWRWSCSCPAPTTSCARWWTTPAPARAWCRTSSPRSSRTAP